MKVGDAVSWSWGQGTATGEIVETFTTRVTRTIKSTKVTRNATEEDPAHLIRQKDGGRVLKSASELHLR